MASSPPRLQPMEESGSGKGKAAAGAAAAALALAVAAVAHFEGKRNDPYLDIVKVPTVCYGQTNVAMRHYSDAQCKDMLAGTLNGYEHGVEKRNPELADRPYMLAAATSLSYNIGLAGYSRSQVAKLFSGRRWRAACDAFLQWRFAGGKEIPGLLNRRRSERALCLTGLS